MYTNGQKSGFSTVKEMFVAEKRRKVFRKPKHESKNGTFFQKMLISKGDDETPTTV